jgi:hypothetical protein
MYVWPRLSTMASGLASDLPGFGRSERRTDPLSPLAMSAFIVVGTGASALRISYAGLSLPGIVAGVVAVRTGSLERPRRESRHGAARHDQRARRPAQ